MDAQAVDLLRSGDAKYWRKHRESRPAWVPSFEGADLSDLNLHSNDYANGWDLSRCRFDGANLRGARIIRANLTGASLRGADLTGASLAHSVLLEADLTGARMAHVELREIKREDEPLEPAVVTCLLCSDDAAASHLGPRVELTCAGCRRYAVARAEFERVLLGELGTPQVRQDRTAATATLDYSEFVRSSNAEGRDAWLEHCPFCSRWSCRAMLGNGGATCACRACGLYELAAPATTPSELDAGARLKISWRLRERFDQHVLAGEAPKPVPVPIDPKRLSEFSQSIQAPDDPLDCLRLLIGWIQARSRPNGGYVELRPIDFAVAHADSPEAMEYLLGQATELGWIEQRVNEGWRLTLDGWKQALEWRRTKSDERQVFVAMSFDPQYEPAFDAMAAAIRASGLKPMRVDKLEHNEKICDRLVAEIRRSRMLVADCSHGSGNVYFEAGFALGLGLTVIWTCKESEKDELRFDTRQYAHILWKDPADLERKLSDRLNATLLPLE